MLKAEQEMVEDCSSHSELKPKPSQLWISNIVFVSMVHLVAIAAILFYRPHFMTLLMCIVLWQLSGFGTGLMVVNYDSDCEGVTMGYHRLWSHRTFEATLGLRILLAALGTIAFQGSIKWWVIRHRLHHRFIDSDNDPHNAKRGLWYSHIGWIFEKVDYPKAKLIDIQDLLDDPVVQFQHRFFIPLALFSAFVLPTALAWMLWNDPLGGLLFGGFVSRVVIWHCIFCINSLAHYIGVQDYSTSNTSRGNMLLAFLTNGEGHHNFHHEFPTDYRNGIRALDYDPTKWAIYLASLLGMAKNLKRTPTNSILNARLTAIQERIRRDASSTSLKQRNKLPKMNLAQMEQKIKAGSILFIVDGYVIDADPYIQEHPGGAEIINSYVGTDATDAFYGGVNSHSSHAQNLLEIFRIAKFDNH